jgi:hypothetical protein
LDHQSIAPNVYDVATGGFQLCRLLWRKGDELLSADTSAAGEETGHHENRNDAENFHAK